MYGMYVLCDVMYIHIYIHILCIVMSIFLLHIYIAFFGGGMLVIQKHRGVMHKVTLRQSGLV